MAGAATAAAPAARSVRRERVMVFWPSGGGIRFGEACIVSCPAGGDAIDRQVMHFGS